MEFKMSPAKKSDRRRLIAAMEELEAKGYAVGMGRDDCSTCASARLSELADKIVYWNMQDEERAFARRGAMTLLPEGIYVGWDGDAEEIMAAFRAQDFQVEWNGDAGLRILILPV
jgi:hypothetical protein